LADRRQQVSLAARGLAQLLQPLFHERLVAVGLEGLQAADLFALEEIGQLVARAGAELQIFLTAPDPAWTGGRGRITPALLERLSADDPQLGEKLRQLLEENADWEAAIPAAPFLGGAMPALRGGFAAGTEIGPYTLIRELGHGGMGTVWLARRNDGRYEGEVAIKFLRSGLFGHGDAARFEREGSTIIHYDQESS